MKGVILAGGLATRLYPLTYATNKHLLPVYDKPMIFYPIQTLVNAGIKDVLIITSGPHAGHFIGVLKNGKELGLNHLEYAYQENPKGGIADALALAEDFADGEPLAVILGDNTTDEDISAAVSSFNEGAMIFCIKLKAQSALEYRALTPTMPQKLRRSLKSPKTLHLILLLPGSIFTMIRCLTLFANASPQSAAN
ncbi:MAG: Glucose-1-phosphate thymidylyltransferase 2 [Microgenomates bacterium OLB23]|nr:MAG: Glucose-1-phosphate thymidylyltransferase 2 [Microgenomates bacterium OLB23]